MTTIIYLRSINSYRLLEVLMYLIILKIDSVVVLRALHEFYIVWFKELEIAFANYFIP